MQYFEQHKDNVRRNMITVVSNDGPVYNAVVRIVSKKLQQGASDPVSTSDVKMFSHIDESDDDGKIAIVIPAACEMIENYSGIGLRKLDVEAVVVNGEGNIQLPFSQYGDVKDKDDNVIDLSDSFSDERLVKYTAGTDTIPADMKVIALMQIDFVLRGGAGLDTQVKQLLQNYVQ